MVTPSTTGEKEVLPRDAKVVAGILSSMGVDDYEPRVLNQLLEFIYRYVSEVLEDAKVYAAHANKQEIDVDDVRLAIQSKVNFSWTQPPPREVLLEFAQTRNQQPLPLLPRTSTGYGVVLPPEPLCLTAPNYHLQPKRATKRPKTEQQHSTASTTTSTATTASTTAPTPMELTQGNNTTPAVKKENTTPSASNMPKVLFNLAGLTDKKL